jgi:hypothetical protein
LDTVVITVSENVAQAPLPESPVVAGTEPDYYVSALDDLIPNDPRYAEQWALPAIGAPSAWGQIPADAPKVTVAVIDSGVCTSHPDLAGRIVNGWDFLENDAIPQDDFGHGCAVSGVIAANINDGIGIAGVAPNAQIMPLRVLNASGIGSYSNVAAAIVYAADNGAQIINLSLGGSNPSSTLESAVNYAISKGVVIVAAAGNNGAEGALYPAAYPNVIAVGSADPNLQHSSFSNYGSQIDTWAPGRDILTTKRDGSYGLVSGTSFAAAHVAGAEAIELVIVHKLALGGSLVNFGNALPPPILLTPIPTTTVSTTTPTTISTSDSLNPDSVDKLEYTVPYLGMTFSYPSTWTLQSLPYKDFGFRISSPNISVDALGRPTSGGYIGATIETISAQEWNDFNFNHSGELINIFGYQGLKLSGIESETFKYVEWHFFAYGKHNIIRFVSSIKDFDSLFPKISEMFANVRLTGSYEAEPTPPSFEQQLNGQAWNNPAILHAFSYGPGKIISDYDASTHQGALDYGLDICEGDKCSASKYNDIVYAPTNIKLVLSTNGYGMPSTSKDYHLFEVTYDFGGKLCLAMGHFLITVPSFTEGKTMPRQAQIRRIINYTPSVNHIHMNLYSVPIGKGCEGGNRVPVPFDSTRTDLRGQSLDGVDYHIGTSYVGAALMSHLYGACARASSLGIEGQGTQYEFTSMDGTGCDGGGLPPPTTTPPPRTPSPGDGIEVCDATNYGTPCKIYTYVSNSTCTNLANDGWDNKIESLRFKGTYMGGYEIILYDDNSCGVYIARIGPSTDASSLGMLNNLTGSFRIESRGPTETPTPPSIDCNNPPDGITLYELPDFRGRCIHVTSDVMYLGNTAFGNDVASSLRIVGNWGVTLFKDADWNGTWQNFTGNFNDLNNTQVGDNEAASVRVWRPGDPCATLPPGVTLYRGRDFTGISQTFSHNVMFLGNEPVGHDHIQSIIVCGRWTVTLFQDPDWNGTWENFTGLDSNLLDNQVNDASSLRMVDSFDFCRTLPRGVTLYRGRNFSGISQTFSRDVMFLGNELIGDNNVKSIRLCGYNARLFRDPDWKGISTDFTGRQDDSLEDDGVYAPHDSVSSLHGWEKPIEKPDLIPNPYSGRSAPVVISSISGTTTNDTLYVGDPVFIDWGYKNNAFANAPAHHVKLAIDGQTIFDHPFSSLNAGATNGFEDQSITWNTPGTFTVSLTVDSQTAVDESDEGNNTWSGEFTWILKPPDQFAKNAPAFGATNQPLSVRLGWTESSGASGYQYCYDMTNDNNCDTTWNDVGIATGVYLPGLSPGITYYWQARATNSDSAAYADGNTWWSFSTGSGASVSTTVNVSSVNIGDTTLVTVNLNNVPVEGYTSAEFTCTYDKSLLKESNIAIGTLFGTNPVSAVNDAQNGSFIVAIAGSNSNKATTSGAVFTFDVKALQAGHTSVECKARVSKGDGNIIVLPSIGPASLTIGGTITPTDTPTPTASATPTFTSTATETPTPSSTSTPTASQTPTPSSTPTATASVTPSQPLIGTLTGQVLATEPIIVRLYDATNKLFASIPANPDGTFNLTAPAGMYTAVATASGFLSAQKDSVPITGGNVTTLPTINLLAGDIDNNNVIDAFDAMTIGMNYNTITPSAADLNNDGIINFLDLELLAKNYRMTGPVAWQ